MAKAAPGRAQQCEDKQCRKQLTHEISPLTYGEARCFFETNDSNYLMFINSALESRCVLIALFTHLKKVSRDQGFVPSIVHDIKRNQIMCAV